MPSSSTRTHSRSRRSSRPGHRGTSPRLQFLRGFLKHPVMVGSIIPSSKTVIERMLAPVDLKNTKLIV
jgi:phospholipid N-methyltransferase